MAVVLYFKVRENIDTLLKPLQNDTSVLLRERAPTDAISFPILQQAETGFLGFDLQWQLVSIVTIVFAAYW